MIKQKRLLYHVYPLHLCIVLFAFFLPCLLPSLSWANLSHGVQKTVLKNGITVLLKEDHSWPTVSVQIWVKTGSANETEREAGISHLIEHMMFKGTKKRKTGEIARCIERLGGNINAYTSFDQTVYYVNIPSKHIDMALDVLLDAIQYSLFDPVELKREKEVVLEEYRRYLDLPNRRLIKEMMRLCYKVHPYRRPVIGYEKNIRSFKREDILRYIDKWYTPNNIIIVAVGDFNPAKVLSEIKEITKRFPRRRGTTLIRPTEPKQKCLRKKVLYGNVHQLYMDMFWHVPSIKHKDTPILDLISYILSNGRLSRLYKRLKVESDLVRSIDSGIYLLKDPGIFYIGALLRPKDFQKTLNIIFLEIGSIRNEYVSEKELKKAKRQAVADFIYGMESMSGQARTLGLFETLGGDFHDVDKYIERIKHATPEDILKVARKYLGYKNLSIGVLAPTGTKIEIETSATRPLKIRLKNGIRLIIKENHKLPVISVTAAFLGGTRLEKKDKWGISNFTARLLTRGTAQRSAKEIALAIESRGGVLEGFSGRNSIGITGKFLKEDARLGLEIMTDILLHPAFPETEIEKVKRDIISDILSKKDYPLPQAFELFYKTIYRHHPYGHPLTGTLNTIGSIKKQDIMNWYDYIARPDNLVISIVGDINSYKAISCLKKRLGDWNKKKALFPTILPEPPILSPRKVYKKREEKQVHIILGFLGSSLKSKENIPMDIVETALSGQGGRLFYELRDKKALAYSVTAFRRPGLETGLFGIYMATAPNKLNVAIKGIFNELKRLKKEGLSIEEIKDAKEYMVGNFMMGLQTNGSQAMQMALNELYGLGYDYIYRFPDMVKGINADQIKRAISKIINLNKYVIVILGPIKKLDF